MSPVRSLGPGRSRHRRPTVTAVGVSHYDGSYVGTIECDQIPGYTRGPLKREFTRQIAGGRAQYARPLILPPTRLLATGLDPTERGAGTVSSTGEVSLTGEAGDLTGGFEATYRGQIDGKLLRLSGVQVWQLSDKATLQTVLHHCRVALRVGQVSEVPMRLMGLVVFLALSVILAPLAAEAQPEERIY